MGIDWEDLWNLGVSRDAMISGDGDNVVVSPRPSRLIVRLLSIIQASPPPSSSSDRVGYLRAIRDALMLCTDWTQMADAPLTPELRAAWTSYRQSLRDLPDNYVAPGPIPWPKEPG